MGFNFVKQNFSLFTSTNFRKLLPAIDQNTYEKAFSED